MNEDQIKHMVDRFLGWRLPKDFSPDAGISFKANFNEHTAHPMKHEPIGTNLFDATQADAMVRYLIEGMPDPAQARRGSMAAQWTYDAEAEAYYFAPMQAAPPPYLKQRHVDAIIDIAADGTLAGVELIDNMPPPPSPLPSDYRCTCGGDPDQPASHHDISCPMALSSTNRKTGK